MIDHVLGRPSVKSRRLQVLGVLAFWSAYLFNGHKHGPPVLRFFSRLLSRRLTSWQTVVMTMLYLYAARNFSTLVGLASPEPLANMYDASYFRATWILTALDAGFWTAMSIRSKWLRDLASMVFSLFYMVAAERADEKVRKVRGNLTVQHLRVSWNKGTQSPYLRAFQGLTRPRFTRWPPRAVRIPRPPSSDYKDPVSAWLYYDGPLSDLEHHNRIVLDIPGGGFVAMDPRCNDDKLFAWAAKTGLPVLSLDYKKAPEYPYPYALNECYDVYCTIINSKGRCVGMSGREVPRVVVTGDSAGGTLATSMTLMIMEATAFPTRQPQQFDGQQQQQQQQQQHAAPPPPDGLVLFYPALDVNIGNWMSDEQMSLIRDRRTRGTNKRIVARKSMQYTSLVGTPHQSDEEDDSTSKATASPAAAAASSASSTVASPTDLRSPATEYAHSGPSSWNKTPHHQDPPSPVLLHARRKGSTSHHPEPLRTRLAMSSMISYFNDRVLTPEMMRAMIILYIGPHNRPDFSTDYLLSPILAPDVLLARFPKTYFLTGERDPLVDDTVIFAGRLRRVRAAMHASGGTRLEYQDQDALVDGFDDRDVAEVTLLPGVSHGFLQFPSVYPPAWKLIDRAARWIDDVFKHALQKERKERRRVVSNARRAGVSKSAGADVSVSMPAVGEEEAADTSVAATADTGAGTCAAPAADDQECHHFRTESSGDEDRGLEMSMTRARGKSIRKEDDTTQAKRAETRARAGTTAGRLQGIPSSTPRGRDGRRVTEGGPSDRGGSPSPLSRASTSINSMGSGAPRGRRKASSKRRVSAKEAKDDDDDRPLVKLNSSDDLLGRRMQGLAGGLTRLPTEPE